LALRPLETAKAPAARLDAPEEQAERPADAPVSRRETPQQQPKRPFEKPALREKAPRSSRGWSVRSALFALLPLALISGAYWYVTGGQVMSTDDAYVEADTVGISTDVPGIVKEIDVSSDDFAGLSPAGQQPRCLLVAQSGRATTANQCPLLMLWTAPPPARECHECGCC
jgi:hypothetical protein